MAQSCTFVNAWITLAARKTSRREWFFRERRDQWASLDNPHLNNPQITEVAKQFGPNTTYLSIENSTYYGH